MPHPPIIMRHASGRPVLIGRDNAIRFLRIDERLALWLGLADAESLAARPFTNPRRASVAEPLGTAPGNIAHPSAASVEAIGGQPASSSMSSPELDHVERIIDGAPAEQVAAIAYAAIARIGQLGPDAGTALGEYAKQHDHGPVADDYQRGLCWIDPALPF